MAHPGIREGNHESFHQIFATHSPQTSQRPQGDTKGRRGERVPVWGHPTCWGRRRTGQKGICSVAMLDMLLKGRDTTQFSQLHFPPTPHLNWFKGGTFGAFRDKLIDRNVTHSGGELVQPPRAGSADPELGEDAAGAPAWILLWDEKGCSASAREEEIRLFESSFHASCQQQHGYFGGLLLFKATYLVMSPSGASCRHRTPLRAGAQANISAAGENWPPVKPFAVIPCPPRAKFGMSFHEGGH